MLLGQDGGGREYSNLLATHRRLEGCAQGQLGLAKPDVSAKEPVHRAVRFHVGLDLRQRRDLVRGLLIGKGRLELLLPCGVRRERDTGPGLAHRVDL